MGELETSVPPFVTFKLIVLLAKTHMGSVAIKIIGMLPAVPIFASKFPPTTSLGLNQSSLDPSIAPSTSALHILAATKTASKCWGFKPCCGLFCRILKMCKDLLMAADRATDRRKIVPLPLFLLPSISNNLASPKRYQ